MKSDKFIAQLSQFALNRSDVLELISYIACIEYSEVRSDEVYELDDVKCGDVLSQLERFVPIAYITKRREFYGRELYVDERVLIPRFETEILVENVLKHAKDNMSVLDLCTGSGAILLSILAENKTLTGVGVDISQDALDVAEKNKIKLLLNDRCKLILNDVLHIDIHETFDIITCNPPYISDSDYETLEPQVKHEPRIALTCGDNGLLFYKKLLSNISRLCTNNSVIFFEIGINQSEPLINYAVALGYKCEIVKDYAGIDRVLVVKI